MKKLNLFKIFIFVELISFYTIINLIINYNTEFRNQLIMIFFLYTIFQISLYLIFTFNYENEN